MAAAKHWCIHFGDVHPVNGPDIVYETVRARTKFGAFLLSVGKALGARGAKTGSGVSHEGACKWTGFASDHANDGRP